MPLWDKWFKGPPPETAPYKLALIGPDGQVIKTRTLRMYPTHLGAVENSATVIGMEFGREAIGHAGHWAKYMEDRKRAS